MPQFARESPQTQDLQDQLCHQLKVDSGLPPDIAMEDDSFRCDAMQIRSEVVRWSCLTARASSDGVGVRMRPQVRVRGRTTAMAARARLGGPGGAEARTQLLDALLSST